MRRWGCLFFGLFLAACATSQRPVVTPSETVVGPARPTVLPTESNQVDLVGLQRELGLERPEGDLGFREKTFETCSAGYGYSSTQNCHQEYFVSIHFQLLCRDSEGTISTALQASDLTPISDRKIVWNLKGPRGHVRTDGGGFGQIRTTSRQSQKTQRLKLAAGPEFLYLRAGEINRIVVPQPWCTSGADDKIVDGR